MMVSNRMLPPGLPASKHVCILGYPSEEGQAAVSRGARIFGEVRSGARWKMIPPGCAFQGTPARRLDFYAVRSGPERGARPEQASRDIHAPSRDGAKIGARAVRKEFRRYHAADECAAGGNRSFPMPVLL